MTQHMIWVGSKEYKLDGDTQVPLSSHKDQMISPECPDISFIRWTIKKEELVHQNQTFLICYYSLSQ